MNDCKRCRELMPEALLGDLAPSASASFEEHVAACPACAAEFRNWRLTLRIMDEREHPDPGEAFWNGYWDRLRDRIEKESPASPPAGRWRKRPATAPPAFPR